MNAQFEHLISQLLITIDLKLEATDENFYILRADDKLDVYLTCHDDKWVLLYCELGEVDENRSILASTNLFGKHWPAHIIGIFEEKTIFWSQYSLDSLTQLELKSWLERFIDDAELHLSQLNAIDQET